MRKTIWEKLFSAPAEILEKSVEVGRELEDGSTSILRA